MSFQGAIGVTNELSTRQDNAQMISVLQASIFPGAKPESIALAIAYCKAANLDIMLKPIHIVPMKVSTGQKDLKGWDIKEMRDVIMPGIGNYRIQASRTCQFAGMTEVEFGPEADFMGVKHPVWAKCTVKRQLQSGLIAEFTAKEFWCENYAEKGDKGQPNAMWSKRSYGQISKCAQAQALRMAFPEIGAHPTYEEMEGKEISPYIEDAQPQAKTTVTAQAITAEIAQELPPCTPDNFTEKLTVWADLVMSGKKTAEQVSKLVRSKYTLTAEQSATLDDLAAVELAS
jgi:phage recombination protein Bet